MSSKDVRVPTASVSALNIQISDSPLLILKEALNVVHAEIKGAKNSLWKPRVPSISADDMDMLRKDREESNGESHSE